MAPHLAPSHGAAMTAGRRVACRRSFRTCSQAKSIITNCPGCGEKTRRLTRFNIVVEAYVIIRPLGKDEARVGDVLRMALLLSAVVTGPLLEGSMVAVWVG